MKQKSETNLRIRQPCFADDRWYSSSTVQLETDIQGYLPDLAPKFALDKLIGLVAPHAGHFFSGHVAGASFAGLTPGAFETVILLGPDHRGIAPGKTSTLNVDAWRTPLGDIPVAWDILDTLQSEIDLKLLSRDDEHSLEIELPFLQVTLKRFKLVPLMMGSQSLQTCRQLAAALIKAIQPQTSPLLEETRGDTSSLVGGIAGDTLFVASSDLSHYFDDDTASRLDQTTLQFILNLDANGLLQHVETGRHRGEPLACGAGPVATAILAAQTLGANQAHLLKYATSADVYPDKTRVVGYAAVAFNQVA
jgi:predicted class III extradiol MEMO1 family dioxygenase